MEITEVRVKLVDPPNDKLQAFCSITLGNDFVIRDLKIIDGPGGPFVAMPSRKLNDRCPKCRFKNHLRARYCNECGSRLGDQRAARDARGRAKLHADIAHPINTSCREHVQATALHAYLEERGKAELPGYVAQELHEIVDFDDDTPMRTGAGKHDGGGDTA